MLVLLRLSANAGYRSSTNGRGRLASCQWATVSPPVRIPRRKPGLNAEAILYNILCLLSDDCVRCKVRTELAVVGADAMGRARDHRMGWRDERIDSTSTYQSLGQSGRVKEQARPDESGSPQSETVPSRTGPLGSGRLELTRLVISDHMGDWLLTSTKT